MEARENRFVLLRESLPWPRRCGGRDHKVEHHGHNESMRCRARSADERERHARDHSYDHEWIEEKLRAWGVIE